MSAECRAKTGVLPSLRSALCAHRSALPFAPDLLYDAPPHGLQLHPDREEVAAALAGEQDVRRLRAGRRRRHAQGVRAGHVPLPQRGRVARRPPRGVHGHGHRQPVPAGVRVQRTAPHGLGRVRPAGRAVRHQERRPPGRDDGQEHRHLPPPDPGPGPELRLGPRGEHHRPRVLQVDAVDLPPAVQQLLRPGAEQGDADRPPAGRAGERDVRRRPRRHDPHAGHRRGAGRDHRRQPPGTALAGADRRRAPRRGRRPTLGLPGRGPGQLVPRPGHRAEQRGDHRRQEPRRRVPRRTPADAAVDAADHRLRRPPDRRPGRPGVARVAEGDAAELDRQERRCRDRL